MKRIWTTGLLGLGLAALAGCSPAQEARVEQNVKGVQQELAQGVGQAQKVAAEQMLEGKVKQVLIARKGLNARGIDVEAKGATITLRGEVPDADQGRLAEQAAMEIEGVQGVINQLTMRVPANETTGYRQPARLPIEGR